MSGEELVASSLAAIIHTVAPLLLHIFVCMSTKKVPGFNLIPPVLEQELRKYKENEKDTEVLMSALSAMQEKTQHLENSLSAETRIKLDLFSALGDAKRQLEIAQGS